ncbi:MAG: RNA-binding protein [Desulfarculaceae bacterium]|nr:RNA-binding protein [Desulfarculaceae bacterium]
MSKNLYVGNLSFDTNDQTLRGLFEQHGDVDSARVITDRESGRSRGFGFVEMSSGADEAIAALDGKDFEGRTLKVNAAKPREPRQDNRW